jgi:putative ABC transport system substrate-binding protein
MKRKINVLALCAVLFAVSFSVSAQQPKKIPRIGYLSGGSASSDAPRTEAFRQGLRQLGYIEGTNILVEYRYSTDRLPEVADELVRLNPDVILAVANPGLRAVRETAKEIPIVFVNVDDPVGSKFVASLARPGGNMTGLTNAAVDVAGKQLELLKEVVPRLTRMAVLLNPSPTSLRRLQEARATSGALGLKLQSFEVRDPREFENAFLNVTRARAGALLVFSNSMFGAYQGRIIEGAAKNRIPAIYLDEGYVKAGGLMSYGPDYVYLYRRAAVYVDKILKGTKPADLPVEQPTKFELVINLKAAKQIGLTIPPNVLARADRVIK